MRYLARAWPLLVTAALGAWFLTTGCALGPYGLIGPDGNLVLQDIIQLQNDPEYENDEALLQALQDLGMDEVLASYFLNHGISNVGPVGPQGEPDATVDDPVVTLSNRDLDATFFIILTGLTTPGTFSVTIESGESKDLILPPGTYSYTGITGGGASVTSGRYVFRSHYRYTWEWWTADGTIETNE